MKRRAYNPFPAAPVSRRSRIDDAIERDIAAATRRAGNIEAQDRKEAALAAAKEAATQPAANDDQTEKTQNG